jgi:hypothetical protein
MRTLQWCDASSRVLPSKRVNSMMNVAWSGSATLPFEKKPPLKCAAQPSWKFLVVFQSAHGRARTLDK